MPNAKERATILDRRRSVIFASAAVAAAISSGLQVGMDNKSPTEAWWEFGSIIVCGVVAFVLRHPDPRRRTAALVFATLFFVVTTPIVAMALKRPTDVVLLFALPLGLAVVFIDRMPVVALVSAVAVAVNVPVLFAIGWSSARRRGAPGLGRDAGGPRANLGDRHRPEGPRARRSERRGRHRARGAAASSRAAGGHALRSEREARGRDRAGAASLPRRWPAPRAGAVEPGRERV